MVRVDGSGMGVANLTSISTLGLKCAAALVIKLNGDKWATPWRQRGIQYEPKKTNVPDY